MTRPVPTGPANWIEASVGNDVITTVNHEAFNAHFCEQAAVSNDVITTVDHGAFNAHFCEQAFVSNDVNTTVVPTYPTNACPTDASRRRSDGRYATSRPDECYATFCPTYSPRRSSLSLSLSLSLSQALPPHEPYPDLSVAPTWSECSASDGIRVAVPSPGNLCEITLEHLSAGGNIKRDNFDESAQARVPPCISDC